MIVTGATPIVPVDADTAGGGGGADPGSFAATSSFKGTAATGVAAANVATGLEGFAARAVSAIGARVFFDVGVDARGATAAAFEGCVAGSTGDATGSGCEAVALSSVSGADGCRGNASNAITVNAVAASAIDRRGVDRRGDGGRCAFWAVATGAMGPA